MKKIDIALIQLRTSIQLYNKDNFIAALTLAGAAEEILGKISKKNSKTNAAIEEKIFIDQIADIYKKDRPSYNKVLNLRHKLKNEIKHNDRGDNDDIIHDFKCEAETFILGAIRNYELIFREIPNDRIIKSFWDRSSL
ncbi:MAG: hypothetical protein WC760_08270 [Bacteroidia bacterium]|jgi:hypothetical protein